MKLFVIALLFRSREQDFHILLQIRAENEYEAEKEAIARAKERLTLRSCDPNLELRSCLTQPVR